MTNEIYMKFKSNFYWKPATLISLLTVYDCFDPAVTAEQSQTRPENLEYSLAGTLQKKFGQTLI